LEEGQAAGGQALFVGLAIGDQAFKVRFQLWQPALEIRAESHEVTDLLDALDRLLEDVDLRVHGCLVR
jgi:hypothetical protein